ncbi:MAG: hypothetical protein WAL38_23700 [Solirubrobacteraceae bacterium]
MEPHVAEVIVVQGQQVVMPEVGGQQDLSTPAEGVCCAPGGRAGWLPL